MTRKQRVMAALNHTEPDQVPKGETSIDASLANRLLGADYPLDYQHFERDLKVRELLNIDLISVGDWPAEAFGRDDHGNTLFRSIYGYEYAQGKSKYITRPAVTDIADAEHYPVPDIRKVSARMISDFVNNSDLFVMAQIGGPVSMVSEMIPIEDYLIYCLTDTKYIRIIAEKVMEFEVAKAKLFIDHGADAIFFADDIAFNTGTFLPPNLMKELVYPFYRQAIKEIKSYKNVPVFFHSDGNLNKVLSNIVEIGFDAIQSLQPSAGMDIAQIKKDYGDSICLMGNIDLDYVMTFASPMEVEETVKTTIEAAAPGGGYIISTCNTFIDAIPTQNALAMYRAADRYGKYGN